MAPIASLRILGFRSADVVVELGPLTAMVGASGSGKSNLLVAVWTLLAPDARGIEPHDAPAGGSRPIRIEALLTSGGRVRLDAVPGAPEVRSGTPPAVVFLPAAERADRLVPDGTALPAPIGRALDGSRSSALALLTALESWPAGDTAGLVLLVEEPELFLPPHAQRALYRLLREFAARGNQVIYSTHEASFLNVARLEELALVERDEGGRTRIRRPQPLPAPDAFRALSEFDAERSELLLARAALLVEGRTEKLVFPFLFRALGADPDREGISIVECGGKPNIPVIAEVCNAVGLPYLVVHDRDATTGKRPIASEVAVNEAIVRVAGRERTVELAPDFEAVARLEGHRHKPERASHWFALARSPDDVPAELAAVVRRTLALARTRHSW
jgi:hypothetical protein